MTRKSWRFFKRGLSKQMKSGVVGICILVFLICMSKSENHYPSSKSERVVDCNYYGINIVILMGEVKPMEISYHPFRLHQHVEGKVSPGSDSQVHLSHIVSALICT